MSEFESSFFLGFGVMTAFYVAYFAALGGVQIYRERRQTRQNYKREFGFEPPEYLSRREIRNQLAVRRQINSPVR